jgi:hypothetical protein
MRRTMMAESNLWLADLVLFTHFVFVLFVVGGQVFILLGWWRRWTNARNFIFRLAHLGAIAFVVVTSWLSVPCPLTIWENYLRSTAGGLPYQKSFIADWLHRLMFFDAPLWVFTLVYSVFGALVVIAFFAYPPVRKGHFPRYP